MLGIFLGRIQTCSLRKPSVWVKSRPKATPPHWSRLSWCPDHWCDDAGNFFRTGTFVSVWISRGRTASVEMLKNPYSILQRSFEDWKQPSCCLVFCEQKDLDHYNLEDVAKSIVTDTGHTPIRCCKTVGTWICLGHWRIGSPETKVILENV